MKRDCYHFYDGNFDSMKLCCYYFRQLSSQKAIMHTFSWRRETFSLQGSWFGAMLSFHAQWAWHWYRVKEDMEGGLIRFEPSSSHGLHGELKNEYGPGGLLHAPWCSTPIDVNWKDTAGSSESEPFSFCKGKGWNELVMCTELLLQSKLSRAKIELEQKL